MPDEPKPPQAPTGTDPSLPPPTFDRPQFSDEERRAYDWIHERTHSDLNDLIQIIYTSPDNPKEPGSKAAQSAKRLWRDLIVARGAIYSSHPVTILNAHWLPTGPSPKEFA